MKPRARRISYIPCRELGVPQVTAEKATKEKGKGKDKGEAKKGEKGSTAAKGDGAARKGDDKGSADCLESAFSSILLFRMEILQSRLL